MISLLLRLEGLTFFLLSTGLYSVMGMGWGTYILLILTPDLSMVGYKKDKKTGAFLYNLIHNYAVSILLVAVGLSLGAKWLISYGLVLTAHIGIDRFLGLGLKYTSGFRDTHLQHV
jgi:hypothetical protein